MFYLHYLIIAADIITYADCLLCRFISLAATLLPPLLRCFRLIDDLRHAAMITPADIYLRFMLLTPLLIDIFMRYYADAFDITLLRC